MLFGWVDEVSHTPGFVAYTSACGWPSISIWRYRQTLAVYPKTWASSSKASSAWPCSQWGLPCGLLLPEARWSLTPPFHPYPNETFRRSILCCAISQVALGGRYPPLCSVEPGSSSVTPNEHCDRGHRETSTFLIIADNINIVKNSLFYKKFRNKR